MHVSMWSDMFHLSLPVAEKILRPVFVYAFLIVGLRLAGKRELAQLNSFDLVVLLTLSNTVQNAIIGDDNSVSGGIIGASALLALNYGVVRFIYSHPWVDRLVEGEPTCLIDKGVVLHDELRNELLTIQELETAAHKQGLASLDEVERAVLEPGGTMSFVPKKTMTDVARHDEVLARLDELTRQVAALRTAAS
jgi:uncharacterized membrane protein YcaP (DUF421 family)